MIRPPAERRKNIRQNEPVDKNRYFSFLLKNGTFSEPVDNRWTFLWHKTGLKTPA
jgi:hypothetical protein